MIALLVLVAIGGLMHAAGTFGGTTSGGTLLAFGYLLLAAYFAGRVVSRLKLPRLTGYLIAGVVSGPFVFDLVTSPMTMKLKIVNDVATCILGLVAGAELKLSQVRPIMRTIRAAMIYAVIGSIILLVGTMYLLRPLFDVFDHATAFESILICIVMGVALTPQSPAIVLAMLSETQSDGPLSQIILAMVVVSDLVVVILYAIVAAVASAYLGAGVDVGATLLEVGWEVLGSIGFGIAIGMLIGAFVRSIGTGGALFALLVCVVVAEIGTTIGLDSLIVMLAAGIWIENFSRADATSLVHEFEAAQLPVFLVWFALAGMRLNLDKLVEWVVPVLAIASARIFAYLVGMRIAAATTKADPVIARYGWTGLVPQAGLSLALIVAVQRTFPTFGQLAATLMLAVLGVNQLISPVLLRIALVRSGEAGRKRAADFAEPPH